MLVAGQGPDTSPSQLPPLYHASIIPAGWALGTAQLQASQWRHLAPLGLLPAPQADGKVGPIDLYHPSLALQLFLDDAKVKNFITCFKDQKFLAFFFKQLEMNRSGRYQDTFPYLSPCGRERNYVRCDDRPIVFTQLLRDAGGRQLLSYCGTGSRLAVAFEPTKLAMLPENGRLYHPAPPKAGGVGLVKSGLAFELSSCFEYGEGPGQPPTHFRWQGERHPLTNELLPILRA
uniref:Chromosome 8 open reading frame 82 n=1 Tax=Crocodylus porosus TaxID=8502 RepID=A0A7M4F5R9_CROPO